MKYLPIDKVLRKLRKKCSDTGRELLARMCGTEMSDADFLGTAWGSRYSFCTVAELGGYFRDRRQPRLFSDCLRAQHSTLLTEESLADYYGREALEADRICRHSFCLLGSDMTDLGAEINWHCDFKTGYCWDRRKYYRNIEIPWGKADIKVPWELSRFQHLSLLGRAYCLSSEEKYAAEFVKQILSWIRSNPVGFGVNWRCTMDVAIRAGNWILGYCYFRGSEHITDEFIVTFLKSIYQHARHIKENLEWNSGRTSNHYLANIAGLLCIGTFFPEFREAEQWRSFSIKELANEMHKQVYPDGCDFEASTCYHRLALEFFFFSTLQVAANQAEDCGQNYRVAAESAFGKEYTEKLYRMFDAVYHLLKPDGMMPQIGDNDSGRYLKPSEREVLDMRYLLALGSVFFEEARWKIREYHCLEEDIVEILTVYGSRGRRIWDSLPWHSLEDAKSKVFCDAGWYIIRADREYCIISCNSSDREANTAHYHSDKLSFELCIEGRDFIVDPGTYVYTVQPEWRNKFRSAAYHNTVVIDGKEQYVFFKNNLFKSRSCSHVSCTKWRSDAEVHIFQGEHHVFSPKKETVIHLRKISLDGISGKWSISDSFRVEGRQRKKSRPAEHFFQWYFHLHPDVRVDTATEDSVVLTNGEVNVQFTVDSNVPLALHVVDSWYSPEYRRKIPTRSLELAYRGVDLPKVLYDLSAVHN